MILVGDARAIPLPDASVAAVVTDPPYELGFMGKHLDRAGVAFDPATWAEVLRVLRPGGRLLAFGAPRTSHRIWCAIEDAGFTIEDTAMWLFGSGFPKHRSKLKPAYEPICVARKGPVSAMNIDGCRIATTEAEREWMRATAHPNGTAAGSAGGFVGYQQDKPGPFNPHSAGRWPANVLLDEDAAAALDAQSGETVGDGVRRAGVGRRPGGFADVGAANGDPRPCGTMYGDSGGASRFFYTAKASRSERERGLDGQPRKPGGAHRHGQGSIGSKDGRDRPVGNHHPTVKPLALMRYLVRLVTQPGELVLDPFTGSGSTGVACVEEGRRFIGIELSPEYAEIARRRIAAAQPTLFADGAA